MTRIEVAPGFSLNIECHGEGDPLVLLHGFTGSAKAWAPLLPYLDARRIVTVDIVGHGDSDAPGNLDHYRMDQAVVDIAAAVRSLGIDRADWLGYSMGGRTLLTLTAAFPGMVSRLATVGASAGLPTEEERAARRASDEELCQRIGRDGVESFIDYWESIPLFASQRTLPADRQEAIRSGRLKNSAAGLSGSLRGMGTGSQAFVDVTQIACPALLLAGELDTKYVSIGRDLAAAMPDARFYAIPGAGHAAHLERPEECAAHINAFLRG